MSQSQSQTNLSRETFTRRLIFDSENLRIVKRNRRFEVTILWLSSAFVAGALIGTLAAEFLQ